jgi:hypothetical protein
MPQFEAAASLTKNGAPAISPCSGQGVFLPPTQPVAPLRGLSCSAPVFDRWPEQYCCIKINDRSECIQGFAWGLHDYKRQRTVAELSVEPDDHGGSYSGTYYGTTPALSSLSSAKSPS